MIKSPTHTYPPLIDMVWRVENVKESIIDGLHHGI